MIAHFQVTPAAWNAFLAVPDETLYQTNPNLVSMRQGGHYVWGYWKEIAGFMLVNMAGPEPALRETYNYFAPNEVAGMWKWHTDGKVEFVTEYAGQHNDILAYQDDHVTYDIDGNEVSRAPASFENPNWANGWAGQGNYKFARSVSRGMGGGYG